MNGRLDSGFPDVGRLFFYVSRFQEEMLKFFSIVFSAGSAEGFNALPQILFLFLHVHGLIIGIYVEPRFRFSPHSLLMTVTFLKPSQPVKGWGRSGYCFPVSCFTLLSVLEHTKCLNGQLDI